MKRAIVVGVGLLIAGTFGMYIMKDKASDRARENVRRATLAMQFPTPFHVTGDENGSLCHSYVHCTGDEGCDQEPWLQHQIPDRDFRDGTEDDHKAWIIEDTLRDMEEIGLACVPPDPFFRLAYAGPPFCEDCGGGGCASKTCPATLPPFGNCPLGGTTCTVTFLCCNFPCPGWPPC